MWKNSFKVPFGYLGGPIYLRTNYTFGKEIFMSTLLDVKKAAVILNLTPQQVRALCRSGKLKSEKVGRSWIIEKTHIDNYYDSNTCGVAEDQVSYLTRAEILATQKPIALSFFSGAMGMDIGLEKAGFKTLLACEVDNACRKTIKKNRPEISLIGDLLDYNPKEIKSKAGLNKYDEIDLIVGGPPCQAFSTAGKRRGFEDARGNVFLSFIDLIISLKPKYAVIENVRGLLSAALVHRPHSERGPDFPPLSRQEKKGGALAHILKQLKDAGYAVSFNLYNAANFGTPQKRERVIMICSRNGKKAPFLTPTHSKTGLYNLPTWNTFRDAVKSLGKIEHHYIKFPEKRLKYYRMLGPGENWRNLPVELQKAALGKTYYSGGGRTGFFRRLSWDKPSPTLVTHPAMPATDLAHPVEDRPLSIEEYKRIQEFPDPWQIEGSLLEQYKQVGNAVPVGLGYSVGIHLMKLLKGEKEFFSKPFPYSRYSNTSETEWKIEFEKRMSKQSLLFP